MLIEILLSQGRVLDPQPDIAAKGRESIRRMHDHVCLRFVQIGIGL
jgi:hypothetical protein